MKKQRKNAKITQEFIDKVKVLLDLGMKNNDAAKLLGCHYGTISEIKVSGFDLAGYKNLINRKHKPIGVNLGEVGIDRPLDNPYINDVLVDIDSRLKSIVFKLDVLMSSNVKGIKKHRSPSQYNTFVSKKLREGLNMTEISMLWKREKK